jgi:hypothetical protein
MSQNETCKTLETQSPRFEKMCEEIHDNGTRLRVSDIMGEKTPNYQSANWQKAKSRTPQEGG